MKQYIRIGAIILAAVLLFVYPLLAPKFYTYLFIEIMIFCILAVSYYLLLGHTGLLSLGHAGYFGVGAYCTALCLLRLPDIPCSAPWRPVCWAVLWQVSLSVSCSFGSRRYIRLRDLEPRPDAVGHRMEGKGCDRGR